MLQIVGIFQAKVLPRLCQQPVFDTGDIGLDVLLDGHPQKRGVANVHIAPPVIGDKYRAIPAGNLVFLQVRLRCVQDALALYHQVVVPAGDFIEEKRVKHAHTLPPSG